MLEEERRFYEENLPQWIDQYADRFVLVKGRDLIGTFNTMEEALAQGARLFGLQSFLVRQVLPNQPELHVPALALGILRANLPHTV
jgi:hypothetical protein